MTRKEAKARLRFIAEWWSPRVAQISMGEDDPDNRPGCVIQIALDCDSPCDGWDKAGLSGDDYGPVTDAWDVYNQRAALRAIDALPE